MTTARYNRDAAGIAPFLIRKKRRGWVVFEVAEDQEVTILGAYSTHAEAVAAVGARRKEPPLTN